jgi:dienelactone hydrolase
MEDLAATWFQYFPGDYRWSTNYSWLIGSIRYGGADMAEIDSIGRLLRLSQADDVAWHARWLELAGQLEERAGKNARKGRTVTASQEYLRASQYYVMSQRFLPPADEVAMSAHGQSVAAFHRFVEYTDQQACEVVAIPYEGHSLPGYFFGSPSRSGAPGPCVVFVGGLGLTKEMKYVRGAAELTRRGVSCLVVDGPGNGEALRSGGMPWRFDYEHPAAAMFDYLGSREDVDSARVAIMGISAGGYSAARAAAKDGRWAACVVWGAIWNYDEVWKRRFDPASGEVLGLPMEYMCWVLGTDTPEEALESLEAYRLEGVADKISCPLLILHGAADQQIPLEDAKKLFDAASSADKELRVFDVASGGAQHCQSDYQLAAITAFADWLKERLV